MEPKHRSFAFTSLLGREILAEALDDGTFFFTKLPDGNYQVGNGSRVYGNGLVKGTSFAGYLTITATFEGRCVTRISILSIFGCNKITGVTIPSTIVTIETQAFDCCTNIEYVNFAKDSSLTEIGFYSFATMRIIETFVIPPSVQIISSRAFDCCNKLKNVYYCGCSNLQEIRNCFESTSVSVIHVTIKYPYSTFAGIGALVDTSGTCIQFSKNGCAALHLTKSVVRFYARFLFLSHVFIEVKPFK